MTDLHALTEWLGVHQDWLAFVIGAIAFIESFAVVGLFVPGVVMLFAAASLAGTGVLDVWTMLLAGFIGAVLGDGISFWLGRVFHERIPGVWPFRSHPQWLEQGEMFFQKHGGLGIAFGRFVGPVRPVIPVVAGMMGMQVPYFLIINILSSIVWAPVYLLPGYFVGASTHWYDHLLIEWLIATGLLLTLAVFAAYVMAALAKRFTLQTLCWWSLALSLGLTAILCEMPFATPLNHLTFSSASNLQTPILTTIFTNITRVGDTGPMVALTVLVVVWLALDVLKTDTGWNFKDRNGWYSIILFGGLALSLESIIRVLKGFFSVSRPELASSTNFAFPSGHAAYTTFIALWLGWYFGRFVSDRVRYLVWSAGLFIAFVVSESRVYLSEHWLIDVFGGTALGLGFFVIWLLIEQRFPLPVRERNVYWRLLQLGALYYILAVTIW